jgi:ectoine hydroxylase-related dioxygenase (phytanoyl-CoA dioxygenase family)
VRQIDLDSTEFFSRNGYLRLAAFHSPARLAALRQRLLAETSRLSRAEGVARTLRKLPVFQQIGKLSSAIAAQDAHEVLVTPELIAQITRLAGRAPSGIQRTQLLLSPARQGDWTLQGLNWHVDIAAKQRNHLPGIQAFFLIDDVAPHGGATLALAGSQRLIPEQANAPSPLREALRMRENPEARLRELGVSIIEMCGRAGDVFLMDMRVLHTPSVNASKQVRLMATCRCLFNS